MHTSAGGSVMTLWPLAKFASEFLKTNSRAAGKPIQQFLKTKPQAAREVQA
jgi:hypothetical protein